MKLKIPRWVQVLFGLIIFGFIVSSLINNWQQIGESNWHFQPLPLFLAMVCLVLYIICHGFLWTWMVRKLNVTLSYRNGVRAYLMSQLAKYIPGGIWSFAALTVTGQQLGVPPSLLNIIYILSLFLVLLASALYSLPLAFIFFNKSPIRLDIIIPLGLIIGLIALPWILRWVIGLVVRWRKLQSSVAVERLTSPRTVYFLILVVMLLHILPAFSFYLYINSLVDITPAQGVFAVMAWSGSWFIGLIILIMPSGLGVREASLILLLQFILPSPVATLLALGYRVFTTVLDLFLLLVLFVMIMVASRKTLLPDSNLSVQNR
jgi:uncharacterized membrane protein YbhN (UPF0104 family)